jgi:hypothetical protein
MSDTTGWPWGLLIFAMLAPAFFLWWRIRPAQSSAQHPAHRVARQSLRSWTSRRSTGADWRDDADVVAHDQVEEWKCFRCSRPPSMRSIRFYNLPPPEGQPTGRHIRGEPVGSDLAGTAGDPRGARPRRRLGP